MNRRSYVTREPNMRPKRKTSQQDIISQEEKKKTYRIRHRKAPTKVLKRNAY